MPTLVATNWSAVGGTLMVMVLGAFAALWAQGAPVNRGMRSALYVTVGFVGSLFLLIGLIALLIPFINPWGPIIAGLAIVVPLWKPFRKAVARIAPIDPESATHAVALIVVSMTLLLAIGSLLAAAQTDVPVPQPTGLVEIVVQHLALVVLSFFAVGLWLRRDRATAMARLGLVQPTARQIVWAVGLAILLTILTVALVAVVPGSTLAGNGIFETITTQVASPVAAIIVALTTAVAMEITFRGALQPRLGLPLTALTYTVVHAQYPLAISLVTLALAAIAFGILRRRANTSTCIISHATFNTLLVVVALLLPTSV